MGRLASAIAAHGLPLPPASESSPPAEAHPAELECEETSNNTEVVGTRGGDDEVVEDRNEDIYDELLRLSGVSVHFDEQPLDDVKKSCDAVQPQLSNATAGPVTLILSNIPSRCVIWNLVSLVQDSGFQGSFEYMYMPMKPKGQQNRGYAFAAFANAEQAAAFQRAVDGAGFGGRLSDKCIGVNVAKTHVQMHRIVAQGLQVRESPWGFVLEPKGSDLPPLWMQMQSQLQ